MKKLLNHDKNNRWLLEGIEFAIEERVGKPENFIGRIKELEFLYQWADNILKKISRSIAFLGRRKIGKSLILERLYNIIYSENKGLIPFYYEFIEGTRSGKEFFMILSHDFICRSLAIICVISLSSGRQSIHKQMSTWKGC
jgi:predicted ATPase